MTPGKPKECPPIPPTAVEVVRACIKLAEAKPGPETTEPTLLVYPGLLERLLGVAVMRLVLALVLVFLGCDVEAGLVRVNCPCLADDGPKQASECSGNRELDFCDDREGYESYCASLCARRGWQHSPDVVLPFHECETCSESWW